MKFKIFIWSLIILNICLSIWYEDTAQWGEVLAWSFAFLLYTEHEVIPEYYASKDSA